MRSTKEFEPSLTVGLTPVLFRAFGAPDSFRERDPRVTLAALAQARHAGCPRGDAAHRGHRRRSAAH